MNAPTPYTELDFWLAGCQGQQLEPTLHNNPHYAEGRLIRELLQARAAEQAQRQNWPQPTAQSEQKHWQAVRRQLQSSHKTHHQAELKPRAGTTDTTGTLHALWRLTKASNQHWFALVACVATLSVGLTLWMPQTHENTFDDASVVLRGNEPAQHMTPRPGQTPQSLANNIIAILNQHQLRFSKNDLPHGGIQIQAKVPLDSPARAALQELGMVLPNHERLNLMITPTP